jgi:DNA mismatch repair protein MutS
MMLQYRQLRAQVPPDALLLFRLGDFYELFFDDAKSAAGLLNLTLTQRNGIPMCGIPYHAAPGYLRRLIAAGRRVAICDQMEAPRPGQVVRREITQILSPGSVLDDASLDARAPNFLASILPRGGVFGLALFDASTGDLRATECATPQALGEELARLRPAEIVVPDDAASALPPLPGPVSTHEGWAFAPDSAAFTLRDQFKTQSLDGFGLGGMHAATGAAGGLLHYASTVLRRPLHHVVTLRVFHTGAFMRLDETTRRTLELVETARAGGDRAHTLLGVLDHTRTGMGARRLRDWVLHPLAQRDPIDERLDAVGWFAGDAFPLHAWQETLGRVRDLERALGRLSQGSTNGRDLIALRDSLAAVPALRAVLDSAGTAPALVQSTADGLHDTPETVALITRAIRPECPPTLREGGVIADGYDAQLDELRSASTGGKDWIAQLQQREIERTGIGSLKVRFNSVFGYYIEITKSNLDRVPGDYHRKQTTANAERFVTPELKEMESRILGAEDKARALEAELFARVRAEVLAQSAAVQSTAAALGTLDALASLAHAARQNGYVRPVLAPARVLRLRDARHPVLERLTLEERFVPNDTELHGDTARLMILTGPNMAGKSTYLRQVALIALMTHVGSFVPAREAEVGLLDRVFTRVGAQDDLTRGQSTFMVEMNETANILNNATERSLVVLDEIGRGTSTFDGLSIAWAVAEHLHNEVGALTLFATHYHETTALSVLLPHCVLFNVAVREWNDQVIFLRKIVPGSADKSYGIQVARLAGLPVPVLDRARHLLQQLEADALVVASQPVRVGRSTRRSANDGAQPDLFLPPATETA